MITGVLRRLMSLPLRWSHHPKEWQLLIRMMIPQLPYTFAAIACGIVSVLLRLIPTLFTIVVFDYVLEGTILRVGAWSLQPGGILAIIGILWLVVLYVQSPAVYGQRLLSTIAGQNTVYRLRRLSYEKLQCLPDAFFQGRSSSKITLRFSSDASAVQWLAGRGGVDTIIDLLMVAAVTGLLFLINAPLTLICLFVLPFYLSELREQLHPLQEEARNLRRTRATIAGDLQEQFLNITTSRRLAHPRIRKSEFEQLNRAMRDGQVHMGNVGGQLDSSATFTLEFTALLIIVVGGLLVLREDTSLGRLVAFYSTAALAFPVFPRLARLNQSYSRAVVGLERIAALMEEPNEVAPLVYQPLMIPYGGIAVENVTFAHTEKRGTTLEGLTLTIPPGCMAAVLGAPGAGKSTLAKIIAGQQRPDRGLVCVDGLNLTTVDPMALGQKIVYIEENPTLFAETLRDNITYGWDWQAEGMDSRTRNAHIRTLSRALGVHDFINALPDGYRTKAGQRGWRLSVQQRAGIALLQALVRRPDIVIIDGIDAYGDPALLEKLRRLVREGVGKGSQRLRLKTICYFTTNPLLAAAADHVAVLAHGKIVEAGTPAHLDTTHSRFAEQLHAYIALSQQWLPQKSTTIPTE